MDHDAIPDIYRFALDHIAEGCVMFHPERDETENVVSFQQIYINRSARRLLGLSGESSRNHRIRLRLSMGERGFSLFEQMRRKYRLGPGTIAGEESLVDFVVMGDQGGESVEERLLCRIETEGNNVVVFCRKPVHTSGSIEFQEMVDRWRRVEEAALLGHWECDPDMRDGFWSDMQYRIHGIHHETDSPSLESLLRVVIPEERERLNGVIREAVEERRGFRTEYRIRKDGSVRHIRVIANLALDKEGMPYRFSGVSQDISDLREMEARFMAVFHSSPVAMSLIDTRTYRKVEMNESLLDLLGYTKEEIVGQTAISIGLFEESSERDEILKELQKNGRIKERKIRFRTKSGELRDGEAYLETFTLEQNRYILAMLLDVTEKNRTRAALQENERFYHLLVDHLPIFFAYIGPDERYNFCNRQYGIFFHRPLQEIIGKTVNEINGEEFYRDLRGPLRKALAGDWQKFQHHIEHSEWGELYYDVNYIPHTDEKGRVEGVISMSLDVTGYIQARKALATARDLAEKAREQADRANQSKSRFLAAASHDLRQPLQAAIMFAGALENASLSVNQRNMLRKLGSSLDALVEILDILLDISRLDAGVVRVNIYDFPVWNVLEQLADHFGIVAESRGLKLRIRYSSAVVKSDPVYLGMILRNLVSNAVKYSERGGVLVGCRSRKDKLLIQVFDTGVGFSPDEEKKIFDEFYQAHNPARDRQKGLGLGLSIVDRLVRLLGHSIRVRSRPGVGSLFEVEVPLRGDSLDHGEDKDASERRFNRTDTIALIDDEHEILEALQSLLEQWGFSVVSAPRVEELIDKIVKGGVNPGLILSDYRLHEEYNGNEAIRRIREGVGQEIPAIILTGDTSPEMILETKRTGFPVLYKPIKPETLRRAIQEILGNIQ